MHSTEFLKSENAVKAEAVRVVGYTYRNGMMWDMVCHNAALGTFTIDPWVGCALEQMTDDEKRAIIGKEFLMRDFWQHNSGVWLCHGFSPNKEDR